MERALNEKVGLESKVGEILSATPEIQIQEFPNDRQFSLSILLPHDCNIYGSIYQNRKAHISNFQVPLELQGYGIGTRLLKIFSEKAKEKGASVITGWIKSESALRTREKVFGKDNLRIYTKDNRQDSISIEVALEILKRGNGPVFCETDL